MVSEWGITDVVEPSGFHDDEKSGSNKAVLYHHHFGRREGMVNAGSPANSDKRVVSLRYH